MKKTDPSEHIYGKRYHIMNFNRWKAEIEKIALMAAVPLYGDSFDLLGFFKRGGCTCQDL
jgi:hypothetical protein